MNKGPTILILGATSAIAQAYARRRASEGSTFVLAGRQVNRLAEVQADLMARGALSAESFVLDLIAADHIEKASNQIRSRFGDLDEIVLAYGLLGSQCEAEVNLPEARLLLETNFTSAVLWILALLKDRPTTRPLTVLAIGSVAGDRGRASNFIYGAAKAGLERALEGLSQKFHNSPIRIITIKPGFVDTPMTSALKKRGPLWASADRIASDMHRAVLYRKRVIYSPWFWWPIMAIIRHLPWFVFKRLKM